MNVAVKISVTIDTGEVYKFCRPVDFKKCIAFMRREVDTLLRMRATDESGYWAYPFPDFLAQRLIEEGLAKPV